MNTVITALLVLIGLCGASTATSKTAGPPFTYAAPNALVGTWEIVAVRVDSEAGPYKLQHVPNDLRFMGIELVIEPTRVIEDVTLVCEKPAWQTRRSTIRREATAWRTPNSSHPKGALVPLDVLGFREFKSSDRVTAYGLRCTNDKTRSHRASSNFFMGKNTDTLYASYAAEVYLVFKRRLLNATPTPSFSCANSLTGTQKAICSSVALAARERASAQLWKSRIEKESLCDTNPLCSIEDRRSFDKSKAEVISEQKNWLLERDKCGNDPPCIREKILDFFEASSVSDQFNNGNSD
jgi:hypothetical protein